MPASLVLKENALIRDVLILVWDIVSVPGENRLAVSENVPESIGI